MLVSQRKAIQISSRTGGMMQVRSHKAIKRGLGGSLRRRHSRSKVRRGIDSMHLQTSVICDKSLGYDSEY
jgi:hypothetical protein